MDILWQWGIEFIRTVQHAHGPVLDAVMRAITEAGSTEAYLFLVPMVFWCIDFDLGARLTVLFLFASYFNTSLKDLFHQPRPFDLAPSVRLWSADGYGMPSGHAQLAVVVWGTIAAWFNRRWLWAMAILLAALIGFSRVYLGLHFPTDVVAGWFVGALILGLYLYLGDATTTWLVSLGLAKQVLLSLAVPIAGILIHPAADTVAAMGALAGAGIGLSVTHRYFPFDARGDAWQRLLRLLLGGLVVLAIYVGLKLVGPGPTSRYYLAYRFFRYSAMGIWSSLGAPWSFRALGLAKVKEAPGHRPS